MSRRRPALTAAAFLTLALGIAALGAVLIVRKAVLVDDPPLRDPDRLVVITGTFTEKGETQDWVSSLIDFADWRRDNRVFEQMSVFTPSEYTMNLTGSGPAERLDSELVSWTYFPMLGVAPEVGRFFTAGEDAVPFRNPVVVLGHDLWRRHFGGDRGIVGRSLDLNGRSYQVVGVAPAGFRGITDKADLWVPSMMPPGPDAVSIRRWRWLASVGRLKPGVTVEQAQADMDRVTGELEKKYPDMNKGMGVRLTPVKEHWFGSLRDGLHILTWITALLFLLACVHTAGLLGARARDGAPVRQLAVYAALLGLGLAAGVLALLMPRSGLALPGYVRFTPDLGAIGILIGLGIGAYLLVALLARGTNAGWGRAVQATALALDVALALSLAVTAGLIFRGERQLTGQDLRFNPHGLLTMRIDLRGPKYADDPPVFDLVHRYLERLPTVPGVETVAIGGPTIATDDWAGGYMTIEDHDNPDSADGTYTAMMHAISPDYFKALGVPLERGRAFTMADTQSFGVIVSESLAKQQWPGQNPLGKRLKYSVRGNQERPWLTVIGVVPDIRQDGYLGQKRPAPDSYLPDLQFQVRIPLTLNFLVRPKPGVSPASLAPAIEREIRAVSPDVAPYDVKTMDERLDRQMETVRFEGRIVLILAALAALLGLAGAYVLGLGRRAVGGAAVAAVVGLAVGVAALAVHKGYLEEVFGFLDGVSPTSPGLLALPAIVLLALTLAAATLAARTPPDPVEEAPAEAGEERARAAR
jgi:hypothetical protein